MGALAMQTRIGVRVLVILAMVAALWVAVPGTGRLSTKAAGQAAFNPPATQGCNVPSGIGGTTLNHYT